MRRLRGPRPPCHIPSSHLVPVCRTREMGKMLRYLMNRAVRGFERQWNYDASYIHEMVDADPMAAWKFQQAAALGKYRKDVPPEVWAAAAITAVRHEDCG